MVTRDVLKVFQIALAYGSCNFENFQNITRAHKSRNALAFMQFPIHRANGASIGLALCFEWIKGWKIIFCQQVKKT